MNLNAANLALKTIFSDYYEINKQSYRWGLDHIQYREKIILIWIQWVLKIKMKQNKFHFNSILFIIFILKLKFNIK